MASKKTVLIVAIDPILIDFTSHEFKEISEITAEKVILGINGSVNELIELGYNTEICWVDLGETANHVMQKHLNEKHFDIVLIGASISKEESDFLSIEKMINNIQETSPKSKICFNKNEWIQPYLFSVGYSKN